MFELRNTASHGGLTAPVSIALTGCVNPPPLPGRSRSDPVKSPPPPPSLCEHMHPEVNRFPLGWHRWRWGGRVTLWQLLLASLSLLRESVPKPQVSSTPPPHSSTPSSFHHSMKDEQAQMKAETSRWRWTEDNKSRDLTWNCYHGDRITNETSSSSGFLHRLLLCDTQSFTVLVTPTLALTCTSTSSHQFLSVVRLASVDFSGVKGLMLSSYTPSSR